MQSKEALNLKLLRDRLKDQARADKIQARRQWRAAQLASSASAAAASVAASATELAGLGLEPVSPEVLAFLQAMQGVQPLAAHHRERRGLDAAGAQAPPRPLPMRMNVELDEQAAMQEAWRDAINTDTLLQTDDGLSWRRPEIGPDVLTKLRQGDWAIRAQLDLHGHRSDEAHAALVLFVRRSQSMGLRCVRVVHGKGLGSPGKAPVLKEKVRKWLSMNRHVLAFVQATPLHGGHGAVLVLLQG